MNVQIVYFWPDDWCIADRKHNPEDGNFLTKDFRWVDCDSDSFLRNAVYSSREKAEEHFKNWLNTLPKAKANRIFACYIANRLCSNG